MRSMFKPARRVGLLLSPALLPLLAGVASAQESAAASAPLETIEVSATRLRGVADDDVPASVNTVRLDGDSNRPLVNVTEALVGIPGVIALDRQNYAQDTQLSIRGFGARSTFGVRGLRLYADGIPASMPDGQGQLSHVNMLGADTMQVMRGPFSALYGNSSGGVVQFWSKPGADGDPTRIRATYGSFDSSSIGAQTMGKVGLFDYNLSASEFKTDGSRDHSAAQRDSVNARIGIDVGESRTLSLVANYLDLPEAQDPLGLTTTEWHADPHAATPVGHPVQYAQVGGTVAGRTGIRAAVRGFTDAARDGLCRQPRRSCSSWRSPWPRRPIRSTPAAWSTSTATIAAATCAGPGKA